MHERIRFNNECSLGTTFAEGRYNINHNMHSPEYAVLLN